MTKAKANDSNVFLKSSIKTPKYATKNEKYLRELASFNAPPEADEDAATHLKPPKRQRKQVRIFVSNEPTVSTEAKAHVAAVSNGNKKRKREVVADSPPNRRHKSQREPTSPATSPETTTARNSRTL